MATNTNKSTNRAEYVALIYRIGLNYRKIAREVKVTETTVRSIILGLNNQHYSDKTKKRIYDFVEAEMNKTYIILTKHFKKAA